MDEFDVDFREWFLSTSESEKFDTVSSLTTLR